MVNRRTHQVLGKINTKLNYVLLGIVLLIIIVGLYFSTSGRTSGKAIGDQRCDDPDHGPRERLTTSKVTAFVA